MRLHPELTQHVARSTAAGVIATGIAVAAMIAGLHGLVPESILVFWGLAQLGCMTLRWHTGRALLHHLDVSPQWEHAIRSYIIAMGISGFVWGLAGVIAVFFADIQSQLFVLAILLGIIGGAVATVSPAFNAYVAYMGGMMGMQIVAFLIGGGRLGALMALLTILYTIVVFVAGRTLSRTMFDSIALRTALESEKEKAEAANVAKSKFLSSMSHELRTPLNAILGFAQLFQMDSDLRDEQKARIHEIRQAGDHLLALINEVLDLARIESGQMQLDLQPTELAGVLRECETLARAMADRNNVRIQFGKMDPDIQLHTDRLRLKQVLLNLLSNGIKYNRKQGLVTLECQALPQDRLRITVRDTGQGIPLSAQPQIFQAFNRLGKEAGQQEGTGIGLVITRELVQRLNGNIGFDSVEGEGSTFWVEFPQSSPVG